MALNPGALPARERPAVELHEWVRRDEEVRTLGANVVVELCSEPRRKPPHPGLGDHPPGGLLSQAPEESQTLRSS